jgi:Oxidoreductase-like protein, N-terminal
VPQASRKEPLRDAPQDTLRDDPPPTPPWRPELDDCCHSGCNPCVFDLYDDALERYQAALAEWQARQPATAKPPERARRTRQGVKRPLA